MDFLTRSIAAFGTQKEDLSWTNLLEEFKKLFSDLGHEITHFGITSDYYDPSQIRSFQRSKKKLLEAFQQSNQIDSLEFYALPENFTQAVFDYFLYAITCENFISLTARKEFLTDDMNGIILALFSHYFDIERYEIFEMMTSDAPLFYIAGANTPDFYKSLHVFEQGPYRGKD